MKWIGQHIWSFISRFRSDVYLEKLSGYTGSTDVLVIDSDKKVRVNNTIGGDHLSFDGSTANGICTYKDANEISVESFITAADSELKVNGTLVMGSTDTLNSSGYLLVANQPNITSLAGFFTGSANQLVTDDGDGTITSHANFTFDGGTATMSASISGETPRFDITNTHADANSGALRFIKNTSDDSPAVNDTLGSIYFIGDDSGNAQHTFAKVLAQPKTVTGGAEGGALTFYVASNDGDLENGLQIIDGNADGELDINIGSGAASVTTIAGTLTMGSTAAMDNAGLLSVANQSNITGVGTLAGLTIGGDLTVNGDTVTFESANADDPIFTIKNTSNNTNDAAQMIFVKDRGTAPAVGTNIGEMRFIGEDSNQNAQEYGGMLCEIDVATDGQESGQFGIWVATHDGELQYGLQITGGDAEDKVNVAIGQGAASTTTVAGDLTVTSKATIPTRKFTATSATHFEHQGDVLYFGGGSTTQGDLCYLKENGEWGQADADGAATGDDADRDAMGMLAIALGTDPDVDGMFIKGIITMDYDLGDVGNPVYISTTAGDMSNAVPGSGDFVRVVGYCLSDADGQMYFNPDNTWVEVA